MIQRKQTLHLLIVFGLLISMFFLDFATLTTGDGTVGETTLTGQDDTITRSTVISSDKVSFNAWGLYSGSEKWVGLPYFATLLIVATVICFFTIFMYRHLWVQVRFCLAMGALVAGLAVYIGMYIYKLADTLPDYAIKYSVADLFPLFALVFLYLAYRGIARDIALLRSADRIR